MAAKASNAAFWRQGAAAILAMTVIGTLAGCQGQTIVEPGAAPSADYQVSVKMDPPTLNPPQLGTLTFGVKDKNGKAVTAFEPALDALMHNILIRNDLLYFKHSYTQNLIDNEASVMQFWPTTGSYTSYTFFKPVGAPLQVFTTTITSGEPSHPPELIDDSDLMKVSGALRVQLVKAPGPLKAGEPSYLVFHFTKRGGPAPILWPFFGAAGQLWIVDENGGNLEHVAGAAVKMQLLAPSTPEAGVTPEATSSIAAASTSRGMFAPQFGNIENAPTFPALPRPVTQALATVAAAPAPTQLPVQQTAGVSLISTPAVLPAVGFGPDVVFTHTFEREGMYKMWLEVMHEGQLSQFDYVVRVEK